MNLDPPRAARKGNAIVAGAEAIARQQPMKKSTIAFYTSKSKIVPGERGFVLMEQRTVYSFGVD